MITHNIVYQNIDWMNITANKLRSEWTKTKFIDRYVQDIMVAIEDRIMDAHRDSRTCIAYGAPVNFSVPEMTNEDSSILVYYAIIQELERRGFVINIEMSTSETTFFITWSNSKQDGHLSHMLSYIASKRTDSNARHKVLKQRKKTKRITPPQAYTQDGVAHVQKTLSSTSTDLSTSFTSISRRSGHGLTDSGAPPPIPEMFRSKKLTTHPSDSQQISESSQTGELKYINDYDDQLI